MPSAFPYTPIPPGCIRLIKLAASDPKETLRCDLTVVNLANQPSYEAISYAWGSEVNKKTISVATKDGFQDVEILDSLASFLQILRTTNVRLFWADSLCINQRDDQEKAQQVKIMGEIFMRASCVLVWLGNDPDKERAKGIRNCLDLICVNRMQIHKMEKNAEKMGRVSADLKLDPEFTAESAESIHRRLEIPLPDSAEFQAWLNFIEVPWFNRAWTFQESVLAQKRIFYYCEWPFSNDTMFYALCGTISLASITYQSTLYQPKKWFRALRRTLDTVSTPSWKSSLTLDDLLQENRGLGCKFASDLIYSIMGVATDPPDIPIDYTQPFEKVFALTAYHMMIVHGNLSIFRRIVQSESELPSWVPDWRVVQDRRASIANDCIYSATGSSRPIVRLSADARVLTLSGIYGDTITAVYTIPPSDADWLDMQLPLNFHEDMVYKPTQERISQASFRLTSLDIMPWSEGLIKPRLRNLTVDDIRLIQKSEVYEDRLKYNKYQEHLSHSTLGRVLIMTERQRLGVALTTVREGDVVLMLLGGQTPHVLRPLPGSDDYTYVTDCYLHGYMDGEALVEARAAAHPAYDCEDISWLEKLHEGEMPFPIQEFQIQ